MTIAELLAAGVAREDIRGLDVHDIGYHARPRSVVGRCGRVLPMGTHVFVDWVSTDGHHVRDLGDCCERTVDLEVIDEDEARALVEGVEP